MLLIGKGFSEKFLFADHIDLVALAWESRNSFLSFSQLVTFSKPKRLILNSGSSQLKLELKPWGFGPVGPQTANAAGVALAWQIDRRQKTVLILLLSVFLAFIILTPLPFPASNLPLFYMVRMNIWPLYFFLLSVVLRFIILTPLLSICLCFTEF